MAVDAGSIYSEIRIELDKLKADLKKSDDAFKKFAKKNKEDSEKTKKNWNDSFKGISVLGLAAITGLTIAAKKMVTTFAQTEQSLANVRAITGASAEEFKRLEDAAAAAGESTRFSASQAADSLYFLASAGFDASQSIEALDGVLLLAGATGSDLASTAETLTAAISQFGLQASDAERVSNVFAAAIGNSQATMSKLQTAFRQVGPIAGTFGISIEETTASLQALFNAGFQGEQSGTALRSILLDLADSTSPVIEKLNAAGIAYDQINPKTVGLTEAIKVLSESGADLATIFGKESVGALLSLTKTATEATGNLDDLENAVTGTNKAAEQYAIQNDTLAGSIDSFKSKAEAASNSLIKNLSPTIRSILDYIGELLSRFTKLPASIQTFIGVAGAGLISVGALASGLKLLGVAVSSVVPGLSLAVGAISAITGAVVGFNDAQRKADFKSVSKEMLSIKESSGEGAGFITEFSKQTGLSLSASIQLAKELGLITDEIADQVKILEEKAKLEKQGADLRQEIKDRRDITDSLKQLTIFTKLNQNQLEAYIKKIAEQYGYSNEQILAMIKNNDVLNGTYGDQLGVIEDILIQQREIAEEDAYYADQRKQRQEKADKEAAERQAAIDRENEERLKKEQELKQAEEERIKELKSLYDDYAKKIKEINTQQEIGLITTKEVLEEQSKALESYIEELITTGSASNEELLQLVSRLKELKKEIDKYKDGSINDVVKRFSDNAQKIAQNLIDLAKKRQEELDKIQKEADEKEAARQAELAQNQKEYEDFLYELQVNALVRSNQEEIDRKVATEEEKNRLDQVYYEKKKEIARQEKAEKEALEKELLENAKKLNEELIKEQEKYAEEILDLTDAIVQSVSKAQNAVEDLKNAVIAEAVKQIKDFVSYVDTGINLLSDILEGDFLTAIDTVGDEIFKIGAQTGNLPLLIAGSVLKAGKEIINFFKSIIGENQKLQKEITKVQLDTEKIILDNYKKALDKKYQEDLDYIQSREDLELQAFLNTLSEKEKAALKAAGVIEETNTERVQRELQEAIAANDAEKAALLKNELEIEKIRDKARQDRQDKEDAYNEALKQYQYERAVFERDLAVAQAEINKQQAVSSLPWYTSKKKKNSLKSEYDELIGLIKSTPLPSFETGGIVMGSGSSTGTPVNVAERGTTELLLNDGPRGEAMIDKFAQKIADKINMSGGLTVNQYNTLSTNPLKELQKAARELYPAIKREAGVRGDSLNGN